MSSLPKFLWGEVVHHVVWLLNRTTTKAIDGMMPFEAMFGKKLDLKGVCEWGETVYVRIEGGTKLGGQVREGKWLGVDEESKGMRIYWPDSKSVTVECNIYFENPSANHFEEEEVVKITKTTSDLPTAKAPPVTDDTTQDAPETSDAELSYKHVHKPMKRIADLLGGRDSWSMAAKPALAPRVQ